MSKLLEWARVYIAKIEKQDSTRDSHEGTLYRNVDLLDLARAIIADAEARHPYPARAGEAGMTAQTAPEERDELLIGVNPASTSKPITLDELERRAKDSTDPTIQAAMSLVNEARQALIQRVREALPEKRDEYYGMVCQDFNHCIPAYVDIQSVEWWNEALDAVTAVLDGLESKQ